MCAHVGPRAAMSPTVANDATEREKAPAWRPGAEDRLAREVLSGVALRAGLRRDGLGSALGALLDRRRDGSRLRRLALGRLAGQDRLAQRVCVLVPVGLPIRPRPSFWLGWAGKSVVGGPPRRSATARERAGEWRCCGSFAQSVTGELPRAGDSCLTTHPATALMCSALRRSGRSRFRVSDQPSRDGYVC